MRRTVTAAAAIVLLGSSLSGDARAQATVTIMSLPAQGRQGRFLGLDVFGGGSQFQTELAPTTETEEAKLPRWGWDAGATISYGIRWLGITGSVGHQAVAENGSAYHVVAGPRVTSPWIVGEDGAIRFFAHALGGVAHTSGVVPSQSSAEWVVGGGLDALLMRLQLDYVRLDLAGLPKNSFRIFVGAFVPLCLRACSESKDGINLSGRPATK